MTVVQKWEFHMETEDEHVRVRVNNYLDSWTNDAAAR